MSAIAGQGWDPPQPILDRCRFHWFHVDPATALVLCVLSEAPSWYVGHFENHRMRKCDGPGCGMCDRGVGKQIRYVLSAVETSTHQNGVIEVSQSVVELLRSWTARTGKLRGMMIELTKATKAKQSRMVVRYLDSSPPGWASQVQPIDVLEALEATWDRIASQ
jgi:hypothetical protein